MAQTEGARLKILVVDDDPEVRKVAGANLEADGHVVLTAASAQDAIQRLDAHPDISLLFTDIVLPGSMDGFDLAELAKRRRPGLQVIYMSGYLRNEGVWEGTLLTKPWTIDDLRAAIATVFAAGGPLGSSTQ
ncbi:MAG TPA: response regulator [Alphaproteobacteria bacterium]